MNPDLGHRTDEPSDLGCCSKDIILFSVVAPLSAVTFWIAGWTASFWLEGIRRSNQEYVHADFGANALLSIFSPIVILIIIGIAWLTLRLANVPRGYIIPIWTTVIAAIVALLLIAGQDATDAYNGWWPLAALGFILLPKHPLFTHTPSMAPLNSRSRRLHPPHVG